MNEWSILGTTLFFGIPIVITIIWGFWALLGWLAFVVVGNIVLYKLYLQEDVKDE